MSEQKIKVSSPGKLMIMGEWAVLEDKKCIAMAVDKRIVCEIDDSDEFEINLLDFKKSSKFRIDNDVFLESDDKIFRFAKFAIQECAKNIEINKTFKIKTNGSSEYNFRR